METKADMNLRQESEQNLL